MSSPPQLARRLSVWDGVLLTIGSVIGTGIFMTPGEMAKTLPHAGLLVLVWLVSGLVIVAGALTYAELGTMFPRAGGVYHFLREAYGPFWGFLYGWTGFLIIMSGGVAAIAFGFGEYFVSFVPVPGGARTVALTAIVLITAVNVLGVQEGAWVQNILTVTKVVSLVGFIAMGLLMPAAAPPTWTAPVPSTGLFSALGVATIAALFAYDGWYAMTFAAGELKDPARDLPRGMVFGMVGVVAVYALVMVVYGRALPVSAMATAPRIAETAATIFAGPTAGRLMAAAITVSAFGCLSSTILYTSRLYPPMAEAGLFFRSLAAVHPRYKTPVRSLWAQSVWASVLVLSGSYSRLFTYVTFATVAFQVMSGLSVIVLRKKLPDAPRPYRTWGYPVVPLLFVAAMVALVVNTLVASPMESLIGVGLTLLGVPAYIYWRRTSPAPA